MTIFISNPENSIGFVLIQWDKDIFIHFLFVFFNFLEISKREKSFSMIKKSDRFIASRPQIECTFA